ncbi:MAG: glycosyltransferase family 2 protein [Verrucomicrobiota bacterium]
MHTAIEIVFWLATAMIVYIYIGYPVIIGLWAWMKEPEPVGGGPVPDCSVLLVGHDEAANLPGKLQSLYDGTLQPLEIVVASDGSDDDTAAVLAQHAKVVYHAFAERRGKAAVLNELVPQCKGEVVVLTDARQELAPDSLERLLSRFADPMVGAVSGELVFRPPEDASPAASGMDLYWTYEKFIRNSEGRVRSVPGATGAFYAIRRSLYQAIPEDSLLDDVAIPMRVVLQGYRCVFEAGAMAYDTPSTTAGKEFVRKRRTIAGNLQVVRQCPDIVKPWKNPIWFQYVSHKLIRLASPGVLLVLFACNLALLDRTLYQVAFAGQLGFYLLAYLGWVLQGLHCRSVVLGVPLMFTSLNVTTAFALWDALRGTYEVAWDRSDKT